MGGVGQAPGGRGALVVYRGRRRRRVGRAPLALSVLMVVCAASRWPDGGDIKRVVTRPQGSLMRPQDNAFISVGKHPAV